MRGLVVVPAVVLVLIASAGQAQVPSRASWCADRQTHVPIDSLRALVWQYHPEALDPARSRDSVLVGFVMDSSCRVVDHAVGRYQADRLGVQGLLTSVIPYTQLNPFLQAGIAEATTNSVTLPGTPWIVWIARKE